MPQRAHVTSVEALEAFRARLVVYAAQARSALEEITSDATRTRLWLENDQRTAWENHVRRRARALDEAQQALFSSRISSLRVESSAEQLQVQRAKRSLEEAQDKLRVVKAWNRDYDNRVQPLLKQMEKLHSVLTHDLVQAAAYLAQAVSTLSDYAAFRPAAGSESGGPAPSGSGPAPGGP